LDNVLKPWPVWTVNPGRRRRRNILDTQTGKPEGCIASSPTFQDKGAGVAAEGVRLKKKEKCTINASVWGGFEKL